MEYYENIRRLRKASGYTQQQLADALQVSRQTVVRWENGWNVPNFRSAQEMARLFGVDVGELMTGERTENGQKYRFGNGALSLFWFFAVCLSGALLFRLLGVYLPGLGGLWDAAAITLFCLFALWWGLKLFTVFYTESDPFARNLFYRTWRLGNFFYGAALCAVLMGVFWSREFSPEFECFGLVFAGMFWYVFCDTFIKILLRGRMLTEKDPLLWCDRIFLIASVAVLVALIALMGLAGGRSAMIFFIVFWVFLGLFGCGYFLFRTLFRLVRSRSLH